MRTTLLGDGTPFCGGHTLTRRPACASEAAACSISNLHGVRRSGSSAIAALATAADWLNASMALALIEA